MSTLHEDLVTNHEKLKKERQKQIARHQAIKKLPWAKDVNVGLVWSPRWDPRTMASEDARMELGIL